jgi:hypothetical protein
MISQTPKEELTFQKGWALFKNACIRQYTNQSPEEHTHSFAHEAKQFEETLSLECQKLDAKLLVKSLEERLDTSLIRDAALAGKKMRVLKRIEGKIENAPKKSDLHQLLVKASNNRYLAKQRYAFIPPPRDRVTDTVEGLRNIPHQVGLSSP